MVFDRKANGRTIQRNSFMRFGNPGKAGNADPRGNHQYGRRPMEEGEEGDISKTHYQKS